MTLLSHLRRRPLLSALAGCTALAGGGLAARAELARRRDRRQLLNDRSFTPYRLVAKHRISDTSSIFVLRPPGDPAAGAAALLERAWAAGALWSVQAKQPQLQIGREYTPLPPAARAATRALYAAGTGGEDDDDDAADLHLLIRKEMNGEMTTYLHGLPVSAAVQLRGPYADVRVPAGCDEIIFIAGGTGISPALQAAHVMAQRGAGARMHILWANRWREECVGGVNENGAENGALRPEGGGRSWAGKLWDQHVKGEVKQVAKEAEEAETKVVPAEKGIMVRIIDEMKASVPEGALRVQYFVDEEDTFVRRSDVQKLLDSSRPDAAGSKPATKLIMVSGPEGFIDYWAGRKRVDDQKESQGPLEGILGEMNLKGWRVWKL
jgi:hypothetical protein